MAPVMQSPTVEYLIKLVRDRAGEGLEDTCLSFSTMPHLIFQKELLKKLGEEMGEYLASLDPRELADVLEVVFAIAKHLHGLDNDGLLALATEKNERLGSFNLGMGMYGPARKV